MAEQESRRGKSRRERVEFARSRNILDVANELQMDKKRKEKKNEAIISRCRS